MADDDSPHPVRAPSYLQVVTEGLSAGLTSIAHRLSLVPHREEPELPSDSEEEDNEVHEVYVQAGHHTVEEEAERAPSRLVPPGSKIVKQRSMLSEVGELEVAEWRALPLLAKRA